MEKRAKLIQYIDKRKGAVSVVIRPERRRRPRRKCLQQHANIGKIEFSVAVQIVCKPDKVGAVQLHCGSARLARHIG
jgi:hypothetical protein